MVRWGNRAAPTPPQTRGIAPASFSLESGSAGSTGQGPSAEVRGFPAAGGRASSESGGHSARGRLEATSRRPSASRGSAPQLAPWPSREAPRATPRPTRGPGLPRPGGRGHPALTSWGVGRPGPAPGPAAARLGVLEGRAPAVSAQPLAPGRGGEAAGCRATGRADAGRGEGLLGFRAGGQLPALRVDSLRPTEARGLPPWGLAPVSPSAAAAFLVLHTQQSRLPPSQPLTLTQRDATRGRSHSLHRRKPNLPPPQTGCLLLWWPSLQPGALCSRRRS